ncbi:carboxypeptidase-like regulatory domain-containing protein [Psychroflexus sp. YR1-1]|uniref:Carboxypeptidase-like regulatory domain-containing protein n=1 Tax=Psychroflexus aurantiacus TaxID=2709310 RepID=A0A6B3QZN2_9FLAO|nr:DUF5686 and carboxypeptidase-like regulatory domain-containing protein [Psychroflexus aurantiacus]NEV93813.1 carboxypeptidase-like regulatory domain-containing protein [Psychroflexus aurantiacus]
MKHIFTLVVLFLSFVSFGQTKVSGYVKDTYGNPIPYVNVYFSNSSEGTISDENGKFYLQSENDYSVLEFSFMGFETLTYPLEKSSTYSIEVELAENSSELSEVMIYSGKTSKKNNPALEILRKIWKNKPDNGLKKFDQYQYDKYEKLEFDLNTIDSSLINSKVFNGMEFIFDDLDTNTVTGKTYLPIYLNEATYQVYGSNVLDLEKEILTGNKNAGFSNNQSLIAFIKDLYAEYNIYDNYLKFFDKSFVSPLSTTGIDNYNYILTDSTFIDDKWSYNIVFYPRRKGELNFKGDFWVNDTTWAIKKINLSMAKGANINWVKDVYIEQEFDVLNDSVFLITKDLFMTDFSFNKKEDSRGVYGKRTTLYDNYEFDQPKAKSFYNYEPEVFNEQVYNRDEDFWAQNRQEDLNNDERQVYKMLDTLKTVDAFKRIYSIGTVLATGYLEREGWDFGPVFSTFGYNEVEGIRLRVGGRTYFSPNDMWRLQGFLAYGFGDDKFKYGLSGKWMIDPKTRLILGAGNRRDVEQLGASLTNTTDVLGRNLASSSVLTVGSNTNLTSINLTSLSLSFEAFRNFIVRAEGNFKSLESASDQFSLAYYTSPERTETKAVTEQVEISSIIQFSPGRETTGYGVERLTINDSDYPEFFLNYTKGLGFITTSDFDYEKIQFYYRQPIQIGGFGEFVSNVELGKTFGAVPLSLLDIVPGNQTLFTIQGTFPLLDFYDFVTDTYLSVNFEHNFNGRFFSRIPLLRDLDLREIISVRAVSGSISEENQLLNASSTIPVLRAPDKEPYWSYSLGVDNIFRILRIDFHFRGNYKDLPDARNFGVTGGFGFSF